MRADAERGGVGCSDLAVEHELVQVEGATVTHLVFREAILATVFLHDGDATQPYHAQLMAKGATEEALADQLQMYDTGRRGGNHRTR